VRTLKRMALDWLLTVGILAGSVHTVYLTTHTHVRTYNGGASVSVAGWSAASYAGQNIGIVFGTPTGACAGIEYWRDGSHAADAYAWPSDC
jgi:hypothetical protein